MGSLDSLLKLEPSIYIIIALSLGLFIVIGWLIYLTIKSYRLQNKYENYIKGNDGISIETKIDNFVRERVQEKEDLINIKKILYDMEELNKLNLQKFGVVRFTAFPGVGSDLSFSIAILDGNNSGFVISSIFGRDDNRIYAKTIEKGLSQYRLSSEEEEAIQIALKK